MRAIALMLCHDFKLVTEVSEQQERFGAIRAEVLLLGGGKSPAYLETALDALETIVPHARRVEFPGRDHVASWNTDRGGKPEPVAQALRRFFAAP